ncbi:MAG: (d)CMP kinase [Anaerolineaceae bacterium]|jgi:cytidylate kinase|nr:(d)CMP kinase [Anaerolineaceae bacterium]
MGNKSYTITLDGPAASGKSTLGERLANSLHFMYLDTGVMYRAVTLAVLKKNIDVNDENMVTRVAEEMDLDIQPASIKDGRSNDVILDGNDVTWEIRLPDVEAHVSQVSAYKGVRVAMTKKQREIGNRGGIVMVGRDIGTVVLPDAEIKLYLDASVEERARRRYLELIHRGKQASYEHVLADLQRRDKIDSSRTIAPLKPAKDAIMVDSDQMNAEEVFQFIFNLINEKKAINQDC